MANPINSNIGPHVNADTTGATALIMRAMTDPNNNIGDKLYKLYGSALDTIRTNEGTRAALEAKSLYDQGKSFSEVLPGMQDKYSTAALAKAKLNDIYSGSLKDIASRDANTRGWNEDARSDKRLGLDAERVGIAKAQLGLLQQKYQDEQNASRLEAELQERMKLDVGLVPSWLEEHKGELKANPTAYKAVMALIGNNSNVDLLPVTAKNAGQVQYANPALAQELLKQTQIRENKNNQGGFEVLVNPDLELKGESLEEYKDKSAKHYGYTGSDAEKWGARVNRIVTKLMAEGATEKEAVAFIRNADSEGWLPWSVNDFDDKAIIDRWRKGQEKVNPNDPNSPTILEQRKHNALILKKDRENLTGLIDNKTIETLNNTHATKVLRAKQMLEQGLINQEQAVNIIGKANADYRASMNAIMGDVNKIRARISDAVK